MGFIEEWTRGGWAGHLPRGGPRGRVVGPKGRCSLGRARAASMARGRRRLDAVDAKPGRHPQRIGPGGVGAPRGRAP